METLEERPTADIPGPFDRRSLNLPNLITLSRFGLSLVLFVLMDYSTRSPQNAGWWRTAAFVFVLAAFTDFLDGYIARRFGQVTTLGRILDPFVDKIIICGAFIFLLGREEESGISRWTTFIVVAREMFITTLRAFLEQQGRDFSAQWAGKIKMILQCLAVPLCLLSLSPDFHEWTDTHMGFDRFLKLRDITIWVMVAATIYSGIEYTWHAFRILSLKR